MIKTLGEEKVNIEKKNKSLSKLIFHLCMKIYECLECKWKIRNYVTQFHWKGQGHGQILLIYPVLHEISYCSDVSLKWNLIK